MRSDSARSVSQCGEQVLPIHCFRFPVRFNHTRYNRSLKLSISLFQTHLGNVHGIVQGDKPMGLPLEIPTLGDKLKEVGYSTHLVGKWHVGMFTPDFLPTRRGFDTFFGECRTESVGTSVCYWPINMPQCAGTGTGTPGQMFSNTFHSKTLICVKAILASIPSMYLCYEMESPGSTWRNVRYNTFSFSRLLTIINIRYLAHDVQI